MATRRRRNGIALVRRKTNPYKDTMIMRELGISRAEVKALKRKTGKTLAKYKRDMKKYTAAFNRSGGQDVLGAHNSPASRVKRKAARKARIAAYKKSGGKASTSTGGGSRTLSAAQIKAGFGGKAAMKGGNGSSRGGRKAGSYQALVKKHGVKKAAAMWANKNPSRRRRNPSRRRNSGAFGGIVLRTNQGTDTGIMPVDYAADMLDRVPVAGPILAPYVAPIAIGAASGALLSYVVDYAESYLPEWAVPYTYPLAGVLGAVVTLMIPVGQTRTKQLIAAGMATVGAGIWSYEMVTGRREDRTALSDAEIVSAAEAEGLAGLALLENPGYGAIAYQENRGYGAYEYTGGDLNGAYSDAAAADALAAGNDFDPAEGRALVAGPQTWWKQFGRPARRMYTAKTQHPYSRHAGQRGHRWGWLIKLLGFEGARKVAAMPPQARLATIHRLKSQARASLQSAAQKAQASTLALNLLPDQSSVYEASGPTGASGYGAPGGYGALVYSGGPL